jgi:F0F1-type ATP synthase membrane subunit b/b'
MQEFIGTTSYWFGWFLFVLFSYFIIYFIYKAFQMAAQNKRERLEY